jgi:pimeloyl-ACP methyl ester carboxylesterase
VATSSPGTVAAAPGSPKARGRRLRWLGAVVVLLLVTVVLAVAFVPPVRVATQVALLVPELTGAGPRILAALTPEPIRTSLSYGPDEDRMDVYRPEGAGSRDGTAPGDDGRPAVLLVLGISPVPLDDERVIRVGTALARLGLVVGVPSSRELMASRLGADEPGRVVAAYEALAGQADVDPYRVGMAGFSVGGSLALVAAADPRIADRVAYVNAFGAYADAGTLLVDVASRTVEVDGAIQPWPPGELAREVLLVALLEAVPEGPQRDRVEAAIAPIVLAASPTPGSFDPDLAASLEGDALAAYRLATAADRATAQAALTSLGPGRRALLDAVSPVASARSISAPVFLMHEVTDDAIPASHLVPLADAIPDPALRRVTEFRLFDHVEVREGVGLDDLPELVRLYGHLVEVVGVALD